MHISGFPVPVYQDPGELEQLRAAVRGLQAKRVLEIGSLFGGTLWCWMQDAPGALVLSIDAGVEHYDTRWNEIESLRRVVWPFWAQQAGCELVQVRGLSQATDSVTTALYNAPFDFIFIDGGHRYTEARTDFDLYYPMLREGGLLAFHDISYPDSPQFGCGRVWREARAQAGRWAEYVRPGCTEWGIGAMWKGAA